MSLVAYDGSSDEEEAAEQEDSGSKVILLNKSPVPDGDLQNGKWVPLLDVLTCNVVPQEIPSRF